MNDRSDYIKKKALNFTKVTLAVSFICALTACPDENTTPSTDCIEAKRVMDDENRPLAIDDYWYEKLNNKKWTFDYVETDLDGLPKDGEFMEYAFEKNSQGIRKIKKIVLSEGDRVNYVENGYAFIGDSVGLDKQALETYTKAILYFEFTQKVRPLNTLVNFIGVKSIHKNRANELRFTYFSCALDNSIPGAGKGGGRGG